MDRHRCGVEDAGAKHGQASLGCITRLSDCTTGRGSFDRAHHGQALSSAGRTAAASVRKSWPARASVQGVLPRNSACQCCPLNVVPCCRPGNGRPGKKDGPSDLAGPSFSRDLRLWRSAIDLAACIAAAPRELGAGVRYLIIASDRLLVGLARSAAQALPQSADRVPPSHRTGTVVDSNRTDTVVAVPQAESTRPDCWSAE